MTMHARFRTQRMNLHAGAFFAFLALALVAMLAAATAAAAKPKADGGSELERKADRDRNKIFDDLEPRVDDEPDSTRVPVIVTLTAPAAARRVESLEKQVGGFGVKDRFEAVPAFAATMTAEQVRALARRPEVAHVEEDSVVRASNDSAQAAFGVTEARADLPGLDGNADGSSAYGPRDLVAAVLDTGIDGGHRDLDEGKVLAFRDLVNGRSAPYDDEGHGTHVAATIAGDGEARTDGRHRGVAPGAGLVGVKVLGADGSGRMSDITAGIDWVIANRAAYGIEAMNLSLGADACSDGTDATSAAVNRAHDAGIVTVVAAGNTGGGTCTIGAPGAAARGLAVGAMADFEQGGFGLARFSSRGRTLDGRIKPDIAAPGVGITSAAANTGTGYVAQSGTSMATPFVAGVALLMREVAPSLTAQQVKDRLMSSAEDWGRGGNNATAGSRGADADYGAGRLDAYAALAAAGAPISSPPAVPQHQLREGTLPGAGAQVDVPLAVSDLRFPVAATLIQPAITGGEASSPDFDLYLFDPSGRLVASAETTGRQEQIGFKPPATGTYTLRVRSYAGSGAFFVDVAAGLGAAAPQPAPTPASATPSALSILTGSLRSGGTAQLSADDGGLFRVNSAYSNGGQVATWTASFANVPNGLSNLRVSFRGSASRTCTQRLVALRTTDNAWVDLDSRSIGSSEIALSGLVPPGPAGDYVTGTSGSGELRLGVTCGRSGWSFVSSADLLRIDFDRPTG